jgi:hypothetical protein
MDRVTLLCLPAVLLLFVYKGLCGHHFGPYPYPAPDLGFDDFALAS